MPFYIFSVSSTGSLIVANGGSLNVETHDNPVEITKYIYIIRNFINDKVYIGQAINPEQRFKGHIQDKDRKQYSSAIDGAIKKYGAENFYYEVIEGPIANFNEREIYWIKFFNSLTPNGYNILEGGQCPPIRKGFSNNKSKFTPEDIEEIRSLLLNPRITLQEIANAFEVSYRTISNLNTGKTYRDDTIDYPIRKFQCSGETSNIVPINTVNAIIEDLIHSNLSIHKIAQKYHVNFSHVDSINKGDRIAYHKDNINYPIRESIRLTQEQVNNIKKDLILGILSKNQIANKYNVEYAVVSNINGGRSYFDENLIYPLKKHEGRYDWDEAVFEQIKCMLKRGVSAKKIAKELHLPNLSMVHDINIGKSHRSPNYSYPICPYTNKYSDELIKEILNEICSTNKSLAKIAKEHNMHKSTVIALKNGSWNRYRLSGYTYPLRPNR